MVVHICNTEGVHSQVIKDTVEYLSSFRGLMYFKASKGITDKDLTNALNIEGIIETFSYYDLTEIAGKYRYKHEIDKNDIVVIISNHKLEYEHFDENKRWFSYFSNNDIIVRSYGWENYTEDRVHLGISHQIAENVFQIISGLTLKTRADSFMYHYDSDTICINNFVIEEDKIKLKLFSGIICQQCIDSYINAGGSLEYFDQVNSILDGIRAELKPKIIAIKQIEDIEVFEDGRIIIGRDVFINFPTKFLSYIYLFFLVNNGKQFTSKNIFSNSCFLESLVKCYNIIYKKSYEAPDIGNLPKVIQTLMTNRNTTKSTFNSYRNKINKLIPKKYGIISTSNGNNTYNFGVDLPPNKIKLPDKFIGFASNC
jgi:hypothetical protein